MRVEPKQVPGEVPKCRWRAELERGRDEELGRTQSRRRRKSRRHQQWGGGAGPAGARGGAYLNGAESA